MSTNFVTRCWLWDKPLQEARERARNHGYKEGARLHFLKNLRNQTADGYTSVTLQVTKANRSKSSR